MTTTKTISSIIPKPPRLQMGLNRKRIFDIKKEIGETFTYNGKTYVCDGFLPQGNLDGEGIFATEFVE